MTTLLHRKNKFTDINCASKNVALSCLKWQEIILSPNKENILDMVWKCHPTRRHERPFLLRFGWFMVFINISVISWRSVLLMEETGAPGENHLPVASHWQTLSHYPNKELLQVVKYRYKESDILHIGETLLYPIELCIWFAPVQTYAPFLQCCTPQRNHLM